jgi:hypothetical protein
MISFVPDANVHAGIVPGVANPISINPRIKPILDLYPLPNGPLIGGGVGTYSSVASNLANENYFVARGDWNISSKDSVFARYVSDRGDFLQPFQGSSLPLWPEQDRTANQYLTLEERRILSSSAVNLLRFSFVRPVETARTTASTGALQFFPGLGREDASLSPGGGVSGVGANPFIPFAFVQNRFNYADDATWTRGAHTFHFGGSIERIQSNAAEPVYQGGQYMFNNLGDFLRGILATFRGVAPQNGDSNRDFREIDFTTYFQDEWKLTPRLTLNFGMRYELRTNPVGVRHPLFAITDPPNGTGFTKVSHVFSSSPNQKNLDPRFGFAWEPFDDRKTSVRGGFGVFHDPVAPRSYAFGSMRNAPYSINFLFGPSFPNPFANVSLPAGPLSTNLGVLYKVDTAPYQMQWNLNLQREIFSRTVFTIGYVASRGVHLLVPRDLNPPLAAAGPDGLPRYGTLTPRGVAANPRINPAFGNLNYNVSDGNSNYNSLQVSLNRRMASHVTAMLSYTWSKCIDNGSGTILLEEGERGLSNPYNARADRGLCSFDLRSNFRGNTVVTLPFRRNPLVRGWQASAIVMANTGYPFSVTDGFDQAGFQNNSQNSRPDAVAGCHAILGKANQWYDPGCFRLEPVGRPGNLGRDTLIGPGLFTADFALLKDTRITESASLQFRAEFFNIFNRTNLGLPDPNLYVPLPATGGGAPNPTAGQITTAATTPRQIQFALKLLF